MANTLDTIKPAHLPLDIPPGLGIINTLRAGHESVIYSVAWAPNGLILASGSDDKTIRLWDAENGKKLLTLKGHTDSVFSVAWSPNGKILASGSQDHTIRLWDAETGEQLRTLKGHTESVYSVAWSPDGKTLASGSGDRTIRLWNPETGEQLQKLQGHDDLIHTVAWSPDGLTLASGSYDTTIRLWDTKTWRQLQTLQGHTSLVFSVVWSPDGEILASGSNDKTIRLWNAKTRETIKILEGHTEKISTLSFSGDGKLLSSSSPNEDCLWQSGAWKLVASINKMIKKLRFWSSTAIALHPHKAIWATLNEVGVGIHIWDLDPAVLLSKPVISAVHYRNAKVIIAGDTGVGKTNLAQALMSELSNPQVSIHGRHVWNLEHKTVEIDQHTKELREILLWDLNNQPGSRLIQQIYFNEIAVAFVIIDAYRVREDSLTGIHYWVNTLNHALRVHGANSIPPKKFLLITQNDPEEILTNSDQLEGLVSELGFQGYFIISDKEGWKIPEFADLIHQQVEWESLPQVSSLETWRRIKDFLLSEKQAGRLISALNDLFVTFMKTEKNSLTEKAAPTEKVASCAGELYTQFITGVGRVESYGLIRRLSIGNLVLFQPELLENYIAAIINAAREEPEGMGCISEVEILKGRFKMSRERIADLETEKLLLGAAVEELLRHGIALREQTETGPILVFPSQLIKEHPVLPDPPGEKVAFEFEGPLQNIYATLVIRLSRCGFFIKKEIWKNAVIYLANKVKGSYGIFLKKLEEGRGELILFFDQAASAEMKIQFEDFIRKHLALRAKPDSLKQR